MSIYQSKERWTPTGQLKQSRSGDSVPQMQTRAVIHTLYILYQPYVLYILYQAYILLPVWVGVSLESKYMHSANHWVSDCSRTAAPSASLCWSLAAACLPYTPYLNPPAVYMSTLDRVFSLHVFSKIWNCPTSRNPFWAYLRDVLLLSTETAKTRDQTPLARVELQCTLLRCQTCALGIIRTDTSIGWTTSRREWVALHPNV